MFILLDPKTCKDELITNFEKCLIQRKHYYFVLYGMGDITSNSMKLSDKEAKEISKSLLTSDIARIGARHGSPLGYHFTIKFDSNKNRGILFSYITEWDECPDIIHQLKAMSETLFYHYEINQLIVLFLIDCKSDKHFIFEIDSSNKITKIINCIV